MPTQTREAIIRATIELFNEYGPMVPMAKISERAGVAAGRSRSGAWASGSARRARTAATEASGGGGIRTLGRGVTPTTVFETAPFNHSGTPPRVPRHSARGAG